MFSRGWCMCLGLSEFKVFTWMFQLFSMCSWAVHGQDWGSPAHLDYKYVFVVASQTRSNTTLSIWTYCMGLAGHHAQVDFKQSNRDIVLKIHSPKGMCCELNYSCLSFRIPATCLPARGRDCAEGAGEDHLVAWHCGPLYWCAGVASINRRSCSCSAV